MVLHLSNPIASGVNNTNRIENEVASVHFARTALAKLPKHSEIVPAVYSWGELKTGTTLPEKGFGWIMMEARRGVQLDEQFKTWSLDDRKVIVEEIAQILTAIQTQPLPAEVDSFGGLTIKDGQIVSGQPTVIAGGPWRTYEEFWTALLNMELSQSEGSPVLNGWRANGVRERVDKFIGRAVRDLLADVDRDQRAFCHGDFSECSETEPRTRLRAQPRTTCSATRTRRRSRRSSTLTFRWSRTRTTSFTRPSPTLAGTCAPRSSARP